MLKELSIRPATQLDFLDIFNWRNSEQVRRGALIPRKITLREHLKWFQENIKNKTLYISYIDKKPLGVVSFTEDQPNSYIWSFYLVPDQQHKAQGKLLMELGILIARNILNAKVLTGEVQFSNLRSRELHRQLGFMRVTDGENFSVYTKELI